MKTLKNILIIFGAVLAIALVGYFVYVWGAVT
jgi:hypothetical protein